MHVHLLTNGSTAGGNGAPTAVTDGTAFRRGEAGVPVDHGIGETAEEVAVIIEAAVTASTVGSVAYVRLWAWFTDAVGTNKWFPLGSGTDANKGKLNDAQAMGETGTDIIRHCERIVLPREAARLYGEYGTLSNITRIDITVVARG